MPKSMMAAYYDRFGEARDVLVVGELPIPIPGDGEVRVRVHASGANPSDFKMRRGVARGGTFERTIPHSDGAGVIDSVGSGVPATRIGERVWIWNAQWQRPFGTAAQYVVVPSFQAPRLPANIDFAAGACLGIPAMTAWRAVYYDGKINGETILVHGGAGSVGNYAVQFAKRGGAHVIATVGSRDKGAIAYEAGADAVVNYAEEDVATRVAELTGGNRVDRVLEVNLAENADGYVHYLKPDGTVIVYGSDNWAAPLPMGSYLEHGLQLKIFIIYNLEGSLRAQALRELAELLETGSLKHRVGASFDLVDIASAHEALEQRTVIGNVVVNIPET